MAVGSSGSKRPRSKYAEVVKVVVGSKERYFFVPMDILCSSSAFFKCALHGDWRESTEGNIKLPGVNEEAFSVYVDWLYNEVLGELHTDALCKSPKPVSCEQQGCYSPFFHAYFLGDFLQDNHFSNAVIDQFIRLTSTLDGHPNSENIRVYWDQIPPASGLRRLLIDVRTYYCVTPSFMDNAETWPDDYLFEVARVWLKPYNKDIEEIKPDERDRCYYHEDKDKPNHCRHNKD